MKDIFRCDECNEPDTSQGIGGWGVNTELWNLYGNGKKMLCMPCFEKRLGRNLTASDFSNTMDNRTNQNVLEILRQEGLTEQQIYDTFKPERFDEKSIPGLYEFFKKMFPEDYI